MSTAEVVATEYSLDPELGRIVIVGGGLATTRLCAVLRRKKFQGSITVVSAEDVPPYDRPPLSKEVLAGKRDDAPLAFDVAKLDVDLRLGTRATGLDAATRTLSTDRGVIEYDALVIATGATPSAFRARGPN